MRRISFATSITPLADRLRTAGLYQALISSCSSTFPADAEKYRASLSKKMWGTRTESEFADAMDDLRKAESVIDKRTYDDSYKATITRFIGYDAAEKRKVCEQTGVSPNGGK